ncbi:MAG: signal peptidase I [Lachnospiraceae bacterium]|nr:signal peptidase I [Lachnospiraceae bacterium]
MNTKTRTQPKWKDILRLFFLILCGGILGINIYLTNARSLVGNQLPMPFGYGAAIVLSGSMEPEFSKGDLIIVKETDTFSVNNIVVFQDGSSLVVHRIIEIQGDIITTKGDANNAADDPIPLSAIKGTVLLSVPFVGNVVSLLKTPFGTLCMIAAAVALTEIPRRKEKQRDYEQRQAIIDEIKRLKEEQQN